MCPFIKIQKLAKNNLGHKKSGQWLPWRGGGSDCGTTGIGSILFLYLGDCHMYMLTL